MKKLLLLILFALLLPLQLHALDTPQLTGRVNDYAAILSPETRSALEQKLAGFERDQSTQIVVLTIPSLQGDDIDQFTIRVADSWKIGQKGKDNGVILVLALAERKVRIEVGMGLQGVLPDITASRIIRERMRPYLKSNDFDRGITAGVEGIMAATRGEFRASPQDMAARSRHTSTSPVTFFLVTALAAIFLGSFSRLLGGVAGAAGLSLAAFLAFPGIGILMLLILAAAGFVGGFLLSLIFSGGWGGGGYYGGGGWGGGFFGGGGSSGDDGGFSGGGGGFDGGGSSDDF